MFPEIINLYEKIDIINRILELPQEVKHLIIQNVIWEENCPFVWNTEIPWEFKLVLTKRPNYEGSVKEFEVIGFNKTLFDFKNCYLVKEIWKILGRFETDLSHGSAAKILWLEGVSMALIHWQATFVVSRKVFNYAYVLKIVLLCFIFSYYKT